MLVLRNADAGIFDREIKIELTRFAGFLRMRAQRNQDFAFFRELDRIAGQIKQNLTEADWIRFNKGRTLRIDIDQQFETLCMSFRGNHFGHSLDDLFERAIDVFDFEFTRLNFREVENIIDELEQGLCTLLNRMAVLTLLLVELGLQQQLIHADNAIHGRTDFVAHIGEKLALGSVGCFCSFLGLLQSLFEAFTLCDVFLDCNIVRGNAQRVFNRRNGSLLPVVLAVFLFIDKQALPLLAGV